ncbi:MAG: CPBP family intramembrane metalloprotease [Bacteroidales bacterium]|nr:CPBP family intramembrane metalloprotease [Bacteroidales bacterium]
MSIKSMPVWKWVLLLILSFVLAFIMYGLAQFATDLAPAGWIRWIAFVAVSVIMILLYGLFVKWFEKHKAKDIPLRKLAGDTAKGFGIGMLFFFLVVGVMMAAGLYKITGFGTDRPGAIVSAFFMFTMVAVAEEILFRGVLFRWIDEKWGFLAALLVSSLLFGVMHIAQPNATWWSSLAIAIEAGLLLGAAYKWSGTLWLPIGIHWAWNFFQGNIFGFAVSGSDSGASLIQSSVAGPDILTGGPFGAEASIITVLFGSALSAWFIFKALKVR